MVALLFNVNTKLSISFFDKLNENSRQQASSCKWEEACFLLMYNVELPCGGDCHAERTISWQVEKCVNVLVYNWFYLIILGKPSSHKKYLQ